MAAHEEARRRIVTCMREQPRSWVTLICDTGSAEARADTVATALLTLQPSTVDVSHIPVRTHKGWVQGRVPGVKEVTRGREGSSRGQDARTTQSNTAHQLNHQDQHQASVPVASVSLLSQSRLGWIVG